MKDNMNEPQNNLATAFETVDRILAPTEPARRTGRTSGDVSKEADPHVADLRNPEVGIQLLKFSLKNDEDGTGHYYLAQCHELMSETLLESADGRDE